MEHAADLAYAAGSPGDTAGATIRLPSVGSCVRQALTHLVEGAAVPAVLFYSVVHFCGLRYAVLAAASWALFVMGLRFGLRRRVSGVLLLSAGLILGRAAIAFTANSSFVYFLQPSLGNFCVAIAFVLSVLLGAPLTRRLADDFCSFPDALRTHAGFRSFFARLTLLWAVICAANGAGSLLLLTYQSLGEFLVLRSVLSYTLVAGGITLSYLWFRSTMRRSGIRIVFGDGAAAAG